MLFFPPPNGNSPAKTKLNKTKQKKKNGFISPFSIFLQRAEQKQNKQFPSISDRESKSGRKRPPPKSKSQQQEGRLQRLSCRWCLNQKHACSVFSAWSKGYTRGFPGKHLQKNPGQSCRCRIRILICTSGWRLRMEGAEHPGSLIHAAGWTTY